MLFYYINMKDLITYLPKYLDKSFKLMSRDAR